MRSQSPVDILEKAGIKPTSNRILVLRAILGCEYPMCLSDLEETLESLEKSSVFRVLTLLLERGVIHAVEDGRGIVRYELCSGHDIPGEGDDLHAHFYCEVCHRVYCFDNIKTPQVDVPDGFEVRNINYMLKGICPDCRHI